MLCLAEYATMRTCRAQDLLAGLQCRTGAPQTALPHLLQCSLRPAVHHLNAVTPPGPLQAALMHAHTANDSNTSGKFLVLATDVL